METGTIKCMIPPELNDSQHTTTTTKNTNNNNNVTNSYFHNEGDSKSNDKKKKSPKHKKSEQPPQQQSQSSINYKNLDEWLESSLAGFSLDPTEILDKIGVNTEPNMMFNNLTSTNYRQSQFNAEPYSIPSEFTYLNIPNSRNYSPLNMQPNYMNGNSINNYNNNQEFVSLPPGLPNLDSLTKKDTDVHVNNTNDDVSQNRRFSDPGLPGTSDNESKESSGNYSKPENNLKENDKNKLLVTLLKQINVLHETNSKIFRNLHETRVEMEALKHAPSWNLRHRRDSISGLSTHSQPLNYALGGGQCHSPAPTYHSQGTYAPGMITDVIREVRETMRVREEALINRMKSMIDERSWSLNEANIRTSRDLEEMKIHIQQLRKDKFETNDRLCKLENEIKSMRAIFSYRMNYQKSPNPTNNSYLGHSQSFSERDMQRPVHLKQNHHTNNNSSDGLRHKRHSLNLSYGIISNDNLEENENIRPMSINNPAVTSNGDHYKMVNYSNDSSHSEDDVHASAENMRYPRTSPKQNGTSLPATRQCGITEESEGQVLQYEKDTLELRRELQDALNSRKNAENKILALEKMVTNLKGRTAHPTVQQEAHIYHNNMHQPQLNGQSPHMQHYSAQSSNSESSNSSDSPKPQKAMTVHTIVSPKNTILSPSNISLKGPVTDL